MVAHPVRVRSPDAAAVSPGPMILQRTDQKFLPSLLDELTRPNWLTTIRKQVACTHDATRTLTLFQPVHRTFHIALLEVVCDTTGTPRLDSTRIDSAGLVVRRFGVMDDSNMVRRDVLEGWMQDTSASPAGPTGHPRALRGWVKLDTRLELDRDPDPARRPAALRSGHPEIDSQLALVHPLGETLAEGVSPLFVAPPDVCAALGKTLLYGLVPVTSAELSEAPSTYEFDVADVRPHMPQLLQCGPAPQLPNAGGELRLADVADAQKSGGPPELLAFVGQLQQLAVEFGAFGAGTAAQAFYQQLNHITLSFSDGSERAAGEFLKEAAGVLLGTDGGGKAVVSMPRAWPKITGDAAQAFAQAACAAMSERLALVAPHVGRFAKASRQYCLRAFVRVKSHDACPPKTVWSDHSDPFVIAPWYAASDAPPVQISLPDANDRDFLKHLKPNVAFVLPKPLFNLLRNDPKKLMAGEAAPDSGGGLSLDWICGFNIPIITLCAFIVLSMFLGLLNLIFWWLPLVKICIPLPRRSTG